MKNIVFVCTGNTCRSPMAEALAKKLADENGLSLSFSSRGTSVYIEEKANPLAKSALKAYSSDLEEHISKLFSELDAQDSELILTMTSRHKEYLQEKYPNYSEKVFTLKEFAGEKGDIADPFGKNKEAYEACAKELYDLINKILTNIQE